MKKSELLKLCRFFNDGGEAEAEEAYSKGGLFLVCWLGESMWVENAGAVVKAQRELRDIVKDMDVATDLPLALRVCLADSLDHFNNALLFEDPSEFRRRLREEVFPHYIASQTTS